MLISAVGSFFKTPGAKAKRKILEGFGRFGKIPESDRRAGFSLHEQKASLAAEPPNPCDDIHISKNRPFSRRRPGSQPPKSVLARVQLIAPQNFSRRGGGGNAESEQEAAEGAEGLDELASAFSAASSKRTLGD